MKRFAMLIGQEILFRFSEYIFGGEISRAIVSCLFPKIFYFYIRGISDFVCKINRIKS